MSLLPKQLKENGLKDDEWSISDGALRDMIRYYTGSRRSEFEREIANGGNRSGNSYGRGRWCDPYYERNLEKYGGIRKFRFGEAEEENIVGALQDLRTEVGGELLTIESAKTPKR